MTFSNIRENSLLSHQLLEADLLKNYGEILLELLGSYYHLFKRVIFFKVTHFEELGKINSLDCNLQNFIEGALSAGKDLQCFLSNLFAFISFFIKNR